MTAFAGSGFAASDTTPAACASDALTDDGRNEAWLDSVPYLVEQARWKKAWAFEALAECYRQGKGVDKCMFNAMMCYGQANQNIGEIARASYAANPNDELGVMNHIMEGLDKNRLSETDALACLDAVCGVKSPWMTFLKEILACDKAARSEMIRSRLATDISGDEYLIGFAFLSMSGDRMSIESLTTPTAANIEKIRAIGAKIPGLFDTVAEKMWQRYAESPEDGQAYVAPALEFMYLADRHGMLSTDNMTAVLTHIERQGKDDRILFSDEDLSRLDAICPKDLRDLVNSIDRTAEPIELPDESPVELIDEKNESNKKRYCICKKMFLNLHVQTVSHPRQMQLTLASRYQVWG